MPRITSLAVFLWIESALLAAFAIWSGFVWLLPAAGVLLLTAALLTRGFAWFGILTALAASIYWILSGKVDDSQALPVAYPVVSLLLGTACAFAGILASLSKIKPARVSAALGRMVVVVHFLSAGAFLAAAYSPVPLPLAFAWAFCGLTVILTTDTFLKLVSRLYTPRRHWDELPAPGAFFFFRWLGAEGRACFPAARVNDDAFSLKLPEMWMWPALRGQLPALAIVALLVAWLSSAGHEVGIGQSGVRQMAGTWGKQILAPGFHLSLPWPLGLIKQVDTGKIYETVLGFRADPGQPILWERAHYEDEQMSLVGGGDDLLSISVPIHYRIADPVAYLRGAADPERLVRDAGNRVLLGLTIRRAAAEVMTHGREEIRRDFHAVLQAELDRDQTGIRITEVCLRDVHPPVQVAPQFQEVLAAMEDKETSIHDGESYRRDFSTRSRSDAFTVVVNAESGASNRLARVQGEVARYNLRRDAWSSSSALFEMREGFRIFDEALADTKKAIFDERIRSTLTTQIDLRKVLNPDLIDNAPSSPESLIPRPSKSRDAFDLDIEGLLRADQGEVPAVSATPDDPDNLMKTNVPNK
jgi:regulator of protease activity HflC (stomatin/prohibitin superfamily)